MSDTDKTATFFISTTGELLIRLRFASSDFNTMDLVRAIPDRRYYKDTVSWTVPVRIETVEKLLQHGFTIDRSLGAYLERKRERREALVSQGVQDLKLQMYPYQNLGVAFVEEHRGRALIADEMGLGKTVQAIGWMQLHRDVSPVVIVVPASLKLNWQREIERWMPKPSVEVLSGSTPRPTTKEILIVNYDVLRGWLPEIQRRAPQLLIADECHYFKNNKALRTKAIKRLAKGIPHIIGLSGTPIYNSPVEIYNAWQIIDPVSCPDHWHYLRYFCNARRTNYGWDFSGASHTDELHQALSSTIMIRRLKKDVLSELPPKVVSFVPVELSNTEEYRKAERNFIEFIRQQKGAEAAERASNAEAFTKTETLKQLAVRGKMPQVLAWIEDFVEVRQKLVVFVTHRFAMDLIMQRFGAVAVKMDGSTSMEQRQHAVDKFQQDENCLLFVGMIDVQGRPAGEGWTLTAASNVAFVELQWSPTTHDQAADRCHRIGQKNCVNVHYLLARGTVEETIVRILDEKRKVIDNTLDGTETPTRSMLREIMDSYSEL